MNRRSEPRFDVYHRAKIIPMDAPGEEIDALLTDISGGGMRLVSTRNLAEETMICVEVGQHLVLAEVRSSTPRGSRFQIGAAKVHTLNLLTLPEKSISAEDRIQALVDDYHLRIQFALEGKQDNGEEADRPPEAAQKPPMETRPVEREAPAPLVQPAIGTPQTVAPTVATPPETQSAAPEVPPELPAVVREQAAEQAGEPPVEPPAVPMQAGTEDPGMAPAMRADPSPAAALPVPVSAPVEVNFGQLRIILPKARALQANQDQGETESPALAAATQATPANASAPDLEGPVEAAVGESSAAPPPMQPIWVSPPKGGGSQAQAPVEIDPLRAIAIQRELATAQEPEPRRNRHKMAIFTAAAVAAMVLIALLFGPIRKHMSLAPAATAGENAKTGENPKELVIQIPPAPPSPESVPAADTNASPGAATASAPAPQAAQPVTTPPPVTVPSKPVDGGSGRAHSSAIRTTGPSWIWACTDGKVLPGKMLAAGASLEIEFSHRALVLVGNAGGVQMDLDGNPLGALGPEGKARVVELTPQGFHLKAAVTSPECADDR